MNPKPVRYKLIMFALLLILIGSNMATYCFCGHRLPAVSGPSAVEPDSMEAADELPDEFALFVEVLGKIVRGYIDPVAMEVLMRGAITGMLETLDDPQTTFFDSKDLENFLIQATGSFSGVGVRIVELEGEVVVLETLPDTPAAGAPILPGDRLQAADGETLFGQGLDRAVELLRGPSGTTVSVTLLRPGAAKPLEYSLTRTEIHSEVVFSRMLAPGVGYLQIISFDSSTGSTFARHLQDLEKQGLERGLIIDLRDNTGGLLEEAIKVAEILVPEGEITRLVDRAGQVKDIHYSHARPKPYRIIVLVNEESASASEIVAGALQDREAALLVGNRTFGKATVQHLEKLSGGNALRLTVAKYLTPSGRDLHGQGLEPDLEIDLPPALKYYRYFIPGRLGRGDYGEGVRLLQQILQELGYDNITADGYFDDVTAGVLQRFQRSAGLPATGSFDDLTWIHLREGLDRIAGERDPQLQAALELLSVSAPLAAGRAGR